MKWEVGELEIVSLESPASSLGETAKKKLALGNEDDGDAYINVVSPTFKTLFVLSTEDNRQK